MTDQLQDNRPRIFWAYKSLIDDHGAELGAYGIAVYCVLSSMGGESGVCFPAIKTIASKMGASESIVKDALKKLNSLHYIAITPRKDPNNPKLNLSNLYTLLPPGLPENPPGLPGTEEVVKMKIKKAYNDTFALYPTPMIEDQLIGLEEEYGEDDLLDAFKEASMHGGRTLAYVRKVLREWKANGRNQKAPEKSAQSQRPPTLEELGYKVVR